MTYETELLFLQRVLEKSRIQMLTVDPYASVDKRIDCRLRELLGVEALYGSDFYGEFCNAKANTLYRMTDMFFCSYIFFILPEEKKHTVALIGPYMSAELTYEELLEQAETHSVPSTLLKQLEKYYASIPVNTEDSLLFSLVTSFAERIWGNEESYSVVDINHEASIDAAPRYGWDDRHIFEETDWNMKAVEARYAHENELIQAVTMGQTHKAEVLMSGFGKLSFERRHSDPVRNLKNYCIIMNTLLRKAAESGGVHPLYIDRISSDFANRIEGLTSTEAVRRLMTKMYTDYCNLVKKQSTGQYSPTVQKTIMHINFGLAGDLSLRTLSDAQNVNASYLSSLFKKETGNTITDYVNRKRVNRAERLLITTKLQIQTISQYCGISDVNYFSKIFKKYTGKTPKEFRRDGTASAKK